MGGARWAMPLDAFFLMSESEQTQMHVAALMPFHLPADAPARFVSDLVAEARRAPVERPWSLRLQTHRAMRQPVHRWIKDGDFDINYHVRHSALPSPAGERELGVLISRLHSNPLDFSRPPWELHVIEGLSERRYAVYVKIHHALVDGFTGMRMMARSLSSDPQDRQTPLFFSVPPPRRPDDAGPRPSILAQFTKAAVGMPGALAAAAGTVVRSRGSGALVGPYQAPDSLLNQRIGRNRRFATQLWDLERLRLISKASGGTLNDVLLAACAGGLRTFLSELDGLPDDPLVAFLPVNVRTPGGNGPSGNVVGAIYAGLGTQLSDPRERMAAIIESTTAAKAELSGLGPEAAMTYSAALLSPGALQIGAAMSGLPSPLSASFNVCISNVPGPSEPLYWRGARLQASYPVSIPVHSMALNITAHSYAGTLAVGFVGDREALPSLQRLAVHTGEALSELEQAYGTAAR